MDDDAIEEGPPLTPVCHICGTPIAAWMLRCSSCRSIAPELRLKHRIP